MGLVDKVKEVAALVQQLGNIELYRTILDLQKDALDSEDEKRKLRDQVLALEEEVRIKGQLAARDNVYWLGDGQEGPFCTGCKDSGKRLIRLHDHDLEGIVWRCPVCEWVGYQPGGRDREREIGEARAHQDTGRDPYTGY